MKTLRSAKLVLSLLVVVAAALALVPTGAAAAVLPVPPGGPTSQSLIGSGTHAKALTIGPDGKVWFAGSQAVQQEGAGASAGSVSASTPVTQIGAEPLGKVAALAGIATGSDGNLWMTSPQADAIVRMTPAGAVTRFSLRQPVSGLLGPTGIVAGPDDALWFTAEGSDAIARIATDGAISGVPLSPGAAPRGIAVGSDGALWVTEPGANAIGRITTGGQVSTYPLPATGAKPNQITRGPDGNLWFTESSGSRIGMITPSGQITEYGAEPAGPIVSGPSGDLWFGSDQGIGSITPNGRLGATYDVLGYSGEVESLVATPEGKLWYGAHAVPSGGGGGAFLLAANQPGSIGEFAVPTPTVTLAKNAKGKGSAWAQVRITCAGGAAGQQCGGTLGLKASGAQIASRQYSFITDETRWVAVKLNDRALNLLRSGTLPGQARVTVSGAPTVSMPVLLHRPPHLKVRG